MTSSGDNDNNVPMGDPDEAQIPEEVEQQQQKRLWSKSTKAAADTDKKYPVVIRLS